MNSMIQLTGELIMEKTKSTLFWSISFGGPVLLGILMGLVYRTGNSTGIFPATWMFLPAASVMIGQLVAKKKDPSLPKLPMGFIITFLATAVLEVLCCFLPFFMDGDTVTTIGNIIFTIGSVVALILLCTEKKESREAYGLSLKNVKKGILIILLFVAIYLAMNIVPSVITNLVNGKPAIDINANNIAEYIMPIVTFLSLPISVFLCFIPYFGEEYGWRYYLQPRLQKKFGKRIGVVILGIVWGLWHAPINMFFYSPETVVQGITIQVIACICLGLFFAWAYMKTGNIWVVTTIHFLNNNMAACFTGSDGSGNEYTWANVAFMAALYAVCFVLPVIFSKVFSKDSDAGTKSISSEPAAETV